MKMNMNIKRMALNAPSNTINRPTTLELHKIKTGAINSYDAAKAKNLRSRAAAMPSLMCYC